MDGVPRAFIFDTKRASNSFFDHNGFVAVDRELRKRRAFVASGSHRRFFSDDRLRITSKCFVLGAQFQTGLQLLRSLLLVITDKCITLKDVIGRLQPIGRQDIPGPSMFARGLPRVLI